LRIVTRIFFPLNKPLKNDPGLGFVTPLAQVYRGYLKPHETLQGEKLEAVVLFNDKRGLVTGLNVSEFHLEKVIKRINQRESRKALVGRPIPMRVRSVELRNLASGIIRERESNSFRGDIINKLL